MFANNSYYDPSVLMSAGNAHTLRLRAALDCYRRAQSQGWLRKVFAAITGRSTALIDLEQLVAQTRVTSRRYVGLRVVALDEIRGSEGRTRDFDDRFNPVGCHTRQRWLNVMLARRADVPLPPVELIRVGEAYFVRDGHHRISVARALGETCIDAEITAWELTEVPATAPAVPASQPASAHATF
jgi:hypothetical protein